MNRLPRTQGPPCLDAQSAAHGEDAADDLERIVSSIGLKVFTLRKSMGLSLQQLGERSDVSAAAIHKIEQGGMVPTITTLLKIAGAVRPVYTSHKGITLSSISGPYARFLLAGARATVTPGASSGRKPMQHPGEELVHLTDGVLEFSVAGQSFVLEPGSSLHFRGDQPHTWRNPADTDAYAVWMALRPQ